MKVKEKVKYSKFECRKDIHIETLGPVAKHLCNFKASGWELVMQFLDKK